ncbi:MAG: D-aminoacyl-tRNA deacylase [Planctomycetota bacterium]|nr:D-aminoacyl-tRNA deacylase [Planctomycetota bacterium]
MKAVVQRVTRAEVRVEGRVVGGCGRGMLILLGVMKGDDAEVALRLAERIAHFRFFPADDGGDEGRMNLSAIDVGAGALVVSQFTLAADGRKGRRPSFDAAAPPELAVPLYETFVESLRGLGLTAETGEFGARMEVELVNDGPVTFHLEEPHPGPDQRSEAV